jgi:hypothetical protein
MSSKEKVIPSQRVNSLSLGFPWAVVVHRASSFYAWQVCCFWLEWHGPERSPIKCCGGWVHWLHWLAFPCRVICRQSVVTDSVDSAHGKCDTTCGRVIVWYLSRRVRGNRRIIQIFWVVFVARCTTIAVVRRHCLCIYYYIKGRDAVMNITNKTSQIWHDGTISSMVIKIYLSICMIWREGVSSCVGVDVLLCCMQDWNVSWYVGSIWTNASAPRGKWLIK